MDVCWKPTFNEWNNPKHLHENKLVCFGIYAAQLEAAGHIKPISWERDYDAIASLGMKVVKAYEDAGVDIDEPFDLFCESALLKYFAKQED